MPVTSVSRDLGPVMHALIAELYPLTRSITGEGLRQTLRRLGALIPLTVHEVPTGTPVLDWTVPREWNIRDAYVKNSRGERVIDYQRHNLHVVNYSAPVHARLSLADLRPHLHTLPDQPALIPYRTTYYQEAWGFCLPHQQLLALPEDEYEVHIDATLAPGALSYGECFLPGEREAEVLISTHACHPSLCNDNLSGLVVAAFLAQSLAGQRRRLSYRFVFVPGTIGAITWLARNEAGLGRIAHGLVLTGVGDPGGLTYKRSRRGHAPIDQAAAHVLRHVDPAHTVQAFSPYGYDERQYCSPGFNLPVGCLMRTPFGQYPEYHTSADDLAFVRPEALARTLDAVSKVLDVLERDRRCLNLSPKGEPQLGRRGLYGALGGQSDAKTQQLALLWVLNYSDGAHSLLAIAELAGLPFAVIAEAADRLEAAGLLRPLAEAAAD